MDKLAIIHQALHKASKEYVGSMHPHLELYPDWSGAIVYFHTISNLIDNHSITVIRWNNLDDMINQLTAYLEEK